MNLSSIKHSRFNDCAFLFKPRSMKYLVTLIVCTSLLSCAGKSKKIIVFYKGKANISLTDKTIQLSDGAGHEQHELQYSDALVELKITNNAGTSSTISIADDGLSIVNLKNDTIIGSYQNFGSAETAPTSISQEELKRSIDSLVNLTKGIVPNNKVFVIAPFKAAFITTNTDATIVGPFYKMPTSLPDTGKKPEVYKFYTMGEVREIIEKLSKMVN